MARRNRDTADLLDAWLDSPDPLRTRGDDDQCASN
ncbi:hypothetical protein VTH06DRAFT_1117 [Thermothelomyces fergusii]